MTRLKYFCQINQNYKPIICSYHYHFFSSNPKSHSGRIKESHPELQVVDSVLHSSAASHTQQPHLSLKDTFTSLVFFFFFFFSLEEDLLSFSKNRKKRPAALFQSMHRLLYSKRAQTGQHQ